MSEGTPIEGMPLEGAPTPVEPLQIEVETVAEFYAEALARKADGHALFLSDDPLRRTLGWTDRVEGDRVFIKLTNARSSPGVSKRIREHLLTPSGRMYLLGATLDGKPQD